MEIYNGKYCVYMHTNKIDGKKYIGLTKHSYNLNERWRNGNGYLNKNKNGNYNQPYFAYAIIKYGWDNFEHEIIASNLTQKEAKRFEELLIEKLDTRNPNKGYNITSGGENYIPSEMTILKRTIQIKETIKEKHRKKSFDLFLDRYENKDPSILKCEKCGALYEIKGKWDKNHMKKIYNHRGRKYCDDCRYDSSRSLKNKIITCIDCGTEIIVNNMNNSSCRCSDCQNKHRKEVNRRRMKKYREETSLK